MSSLRRLVQESLRAVADPGKAAPMAAYMKTEMPFYGVTATLRRPIARELKQRFPASGPEEYRRNVLVLWELPHREEKYLAIDYAQGFPQLIRFEQVDLYRAMIQEGAWWDLVDGIAAHLTGRVLLTDRGRMAPVLSEWIDHEDLWLRRTALLGQLRHRDATDEEMLFDFCLRRASETEFFIRKAIGWALREYAHTNPDAVRRFLAAHGERLSGLSRREAAKHL
jgi:3-methyladenine DNA glycosylase AlkD